MPIIPITTTDALAIFCKRQKNAEFLTVDTEFMREKTYYPILCLIQIGGPAEAAIIDPMATGINLEPIHDLMCDKSILKVFHAARQDMEIFYYEMGELPSPIFDTQLAAMVSGFGDQIGYEPLVAKITGVRMNKQSRISDWSRRPLTPQQLTYALGDVTHLRPVYEKLNSSLIESGRSHWLDEEMAVLTAKKTYSANPSDAWQRIKTRSNEPRFLALLQAVAAWREREAQRSDKPRNRIARDDTLLDLAGRAPSNFEGLSRTRGLSPNLARGRSGEMLLSAIAKGQSVPEYRAPTKKIKKPLPPGVGPVTELLKVMLKRCSEEMGVASKLIATVSELEQIAADDNADVRTLKGWRKKIFGNQALALKRGEISITIEKNLIKIIPKFTA